MKGACEGTKNPYSSLTGADSFRSAPQRTLLAPSGWYPLGHSVPHANPLPLAFVFGVALASFLMSGLGSA
jgi:hypothetical protein